MIPWRQYVNCIAHYMCPVQWHKGLFIMGFTKRWTGPENGLENGPENGLENRMENGMERKV